MLCDLKDPRERTIHRGRQLTGVAGVFLQTVFPSEVEFGDLGLQFVDRAVHGGVEAARRVRVYVDGLLVPVDCGLVVTRSTKIRMLR